MPVSGEFISGKAGPLALVAFRRHASVPPRFAALHLPAFGDEMNKARRMVALQARAFESMGGVTYVLDPRGTGDSAGELADATWQDWRDDALTAWQRLREDSGEDVPFLLWGLRLGALLAYDLVATAALAPSALLMWQPVTAGRTFFDQFLRIASLQDPGGAGGAPSRSELRQRLAAGEAVRVGGYALGPGLVNGAESIAIERGPPPSCRVIWRDCVASEAPVAGPVTARIESSWRSQGVHLDLAAVTGPSFWAALEIEEAPALVAGTCEAVTRAGIAPGSDR